MKEGESVSRCENVLSSLYLVIETKHVYLRGMTLQMLRIPGVCSVPTTAARHTCGSVF